MQTDAKTARTDSMDHTTYKFHHAMMNILMAHNNPAIIAIMLTAAVFLVAFLLIHKCQSLVASPRVRMSTDAAANLLDWMDASQAVSIAPSECGAGQGLFLNHDCAKDDVLFVIPESKVISVEDAWEDDALGEAFSYLSEEGGSGGKMAALAGFVANEMLKEEASDWFPYLSMLQQQSDDSHVLYWSDDQVESLLVGSNVYEQVHTLRDDTDSAMQVLWQLVQTELENPLPSKQTWDAAVRASYVAILSRAFEDPYVDDCTKLLPVLDMTQHDAEEGNLNHSTDDSGSVTVKARYDLQAGQELTIEYSTDLLPHEYFPLYGFCPGQERSCRDLLKAHSPIFFPATV